MSQLYTTKPDLESLIENSAVENLQLEFKRFKAIDGKLEQKDKDTLGKEIVAMANAEGGSIIIGIDEDGKRCASKLIDAGIVSEELDGFQLSIQQYLLAKVRPRLYGVTYTGIAVEEDQIAVVINVPKSYGRPHALNDGNKDMFYIRHSNGVTNMSVDDLRKQFLLSSSAKTEIREFRHDRISLLMADEGPLELKEGAKLLIHIIPLWSLELGSGIDLSIVKNDHSEATKPLFTSGLNYNYNSDGFITHGEEYQGQGQYSKTKSYIQYFRNGIVELVNINAMNFQEKLTRDWADIESGMCKKIKACLEFLSKLSVPAPFYIYISLLGAKGFRSNSEFFWEYAIDRDIVNSVECVFDGELCIEEAIRPTFDSLANAFGGSGSFNYDEDGNYVF